MYCARSATIPATVFITPYANSLMQQNPQTATQDRPQTRRLVPQAKMHRASVAIPQRLFLMKQALAYLLKDMGLWTGPLTYPYIIERGIQCIMKEYGITREQVEEVIRFLTDGGGEPGQ